MVQPFWAHHHSKWDEVLADTCSESSYSHTWPWTSAGEGSMGTSVLEVTEQAFNEFSPYKQQSQDNSNIGNNILNTSKE